MILSFHRHHMPSFDPHYVERGKKIKHLTCGKPKKDQMNLDRFLTDHPLDNVYLHNEERMSGYCVLSF